MGLMNENKETVYVLMVYDNDLISISKDKEKLEKLAMTHEKNNMFASTLIQKYIVENKDGCYVFKEGENL